MQIPKRLKNSRIKAQNLIEFMFIFPILLFITLVIFEVALFWQETNAIYNLNTEINANLALFDNTKNNAMELGERCLAATRALEILEAKDDGISLSKPTYTSEVVDGQEPFALYKYHTPNTIAPSDGGAPKPQISLWVDCRNPFEEGYTTQIEFYHKTVIIKATIPRFDAKPAGVSDKDWRITVIPDNIFIASPKLSTNRHY